MPADETYIIDICDRVLESTASRQHRFDFLRGDAGHRLPVDAYYAERGLAIEYHEVQHTTAVPFMDKKFTVSGIGRGEQRKLYGDRRRKVLPENSIKLVILDYTMFKQKSSKRLLRDPCADEAVIRDHLKDYIVP